ncbi:MAG: N-glycosylase/DNA lyase [Candidatus Omnitrophota bacterium]|nr:N-glycosylase/DNA lyase [Candidatus Omnitrophota bacterium]
MSRYKRLTEEYRNKKTAIKERLEEFKNIGKKKKDEIFSELCFCLLTPQSNARHCDKAIQELKERGLLLKGNAASIRNILKGKARFHNKKAEYIVGARACFDKSIFECGNAIKIRDLLVSQIKGLGYKEASHFLRNIGMGQDIAILDRHILKNLKRYGAIDNIPASLTPRLYLNIEERAKAFAKRIKIPLAELDLLFWQKETGQIFK